MTFMSTPTEQIAWQEVFEVRKMVREDTVKPTHCNGSPTDILDTWQTFIYGYFNILFDSGLALKKIKKIIL